MKRLSKLQRWGIVQSSATLIAMILGMISSQMAYSLTSMPWIIAFSAAGIVLCGAAIIFAQKIPPMLRDGIFLATSILNALALGGMIQGRTKLMGYVYFSDLESSNPTAVMAMNLAIAAWALYLVALVVNIGIGYSRQIED